MSIQKSILRASNLLGQNETVGVTLAKRSA